VGFFENRSQNRRNGLLWLLVISLSLFLCGCNSGSGAGDDRTTITRLLMDTRVDLTLYGVDKKTSEQVAEAVFSEMERLEMILSRTILSSELSSINEAAGKMWVEVTPEFFAFLKKVLEFSALSEGAFDPTVAPLLDLWGFMGEGQPKVPTEDELRDALTLVDYSLVELDEDALGVYLPLEGMMLDFGGIAKGYIIDRGVEIAREFDLEAFFINAGGDIRMYGKKPSGEKWSIAVQDPRENPDVYSNIAILRLEGDGSIVTSGDYQRFFEINGEKYHHIMDPWAGKPVDHLASVTIVTDDAMTADALSTAVFVLGKELGLSLLESLPGIEGLVVDPEGGVYYTTGLEGIVEFP